jgi:cation transport regulator ChaB
MPEDKATVYQTRLQAGEYLVMVEVPANQVEEFQNLIQAHGGEEIHVLEQKLPRACSGRCNSPEDLSPEVRSHLSPEAQRTFIDTYNATLEQTNDQSQAEQAAWEAVHQKFDEDENGVWSKAKVTA